ncbi:MAG TPA: type I-E CRISPR-associated protein Cas6/Cse3/CasE [Limnochordia bacterium]|nr:type I-E CRISPR-associated protein Cas6/Cse3/CasE [Limnochordia bacterium]
MILNMVEIQLELTAFHGYIYGPGNYGTRWEVDYGYAIHQWLAAAFGELTPKPWRFFLHRGNYARILGYSVVDCQQLQTQLKEFAVPSVLSVCPRPEEMIRSKQMPNWQKGRKLGFQVLCCPVGRKAGGGTEKDLFLVKADGGVTGLRREKVYGEWLKERFEAGGASVREVRLSGFRLVNQRRQTQYQQPQGRKSVTITRPHALLEGELVVSDQERFMQLLASGLGRHRSFGYGMILLRPPQ